MLSRVAESLYWAGRYTERAENTARFVDVNLQMSLDSPIAFSEQWEPLVAITGNRAGFRERYDEASRENVIQFLTSDLDNPSSIVSCVRQARENARSVREVIASDVWEQMNRFYLLVSNRIAAKRALTDSSDFFGEIRNVAQLLWGVVDNSMSHGEAWHFYRLGRLIERSDNTSRLVDVKYFLILPIAEEVGGAVDEMQWSVLLRSVSAFEMYRQRYGRIEPEKVIDFLLLNTDFPRAILFCLMRTEESLHAISGSRAGTFGNRAEQRFGRLRSELAYANVYDIIASGLHEFLDGFQGKLNAASLAIAETFFSLEPVMSMNGAGGMRRRDVLLGDKGQ